MIKKRPKKGGINMKRGSFYLLLGVATIAGYMFVSRKIEDTRDFR